jgi:ribulose-bisphosphate carboxylase large chain
MSHPGGASNGVVALRQAAEAARQGIEIEEFGSAHSELRAAMEAFAKPEIEMV